MSASATETELRLDFTIDPSITVQVVGAVLEVSDGGAAPITVTGQTGANLVDDWANQLPAPVTGTTYRVSLPIASGPEGFIRLGLTVP